MLISDKMMGEYVLYTCQIFEFYFMFDEVEYLGCTRVCVCGCMLEVDHHKVREMERRKGIPNLHREQLWGQMSNSRLKESILQI